MNKKSGWIFVLFLFIGIVIGGFLGTYFAESPILSWLNYGQVFTLSPEFNFSIIEFDMNLKISINLASIIGILLAIFAYRKMK
ncbi:DUF4321 domain-containing protein [Vallitalea okinawensis]|uniref:DUF4321 domain-containing protein n=1 Tax=Vallitalea okinawensis TaxID=2078660 RepID=UPI000CFBE67B|nr:DUF4321 domain-containing protein [Vallitalea okinawensis]